jgi:hypothetical protein
MGGFLEIPGLRYALAALVTVIVTGFIVQQISVLRSVSALESRLSRPEAPRIRLAYTLSPEGIEQLRRSEEVRAILQAQGTGRSHNLEKLGGEHAGTIAALIDSPESRQVLRALVPAAGGPAMENLLKILSLNARLVLTYSKGEVPQ